MQTLKSVPELRVALAGAPRPVGFVPTMGALHDGHAELVRRCRDECATVVASVFVNPLQFGASEDLERYPRDLDADAALLATLGTSVLFAPAVETFYPGDFVTRVDCGSLGERYEGAARPGHFTGVCTVVAKLFHIVSPDRAYFGEKDAQQLAVIRRMVRDLDLPVRIVAVETVRDADGLALSSRNAYLSSAERRQALGLGAGLFAARKAWQAGERDPDRLVEAARTPGLEYDYLDCVDPDRFERPGPLLIAAARVGSTRLIDNLRLDRS